MNFCNLGHVNKNSSDFTLSYRSYAFTITVGNWFEDACLNESRELLATLMADLHEHIVKWNGAFGTYVPQNISSRQIHLLELLFALFRCGSVLLWSYIDADYVVETPARYRPFNAKSRRYLHFLYQVVYSQVHCFYMRLKDKLDFNFNSLVSFNSKKSLFGHSCSHLGGTISTGN